MVHGQCRATPKTGDMTVKTIAIIGEISVLSAVPFFQAKLRKLILEITLTKLRPT
jgi:hypothetical protein